MGFDLQYLLFLQNLRESTGGVFDEFFNALSKFAVVVWPLVIRKTCTTKSKAAQTA